MVWTPVRHVDCCCLLWMIGLVKWVLPTLMPGFPIGLLPVLVTVPFRDPLCILLSSEQLKWYGLGLQLWAAYPVCTLYRCHGYEANSLASIDRSTNVRAYNVLSLPTYLPTSQHHAYLHWLSWLLKIFQTVTWSWAAISASSVDQPNPNLRKSLRMTSVHSVLSLPWYTFVSHGMVSIDTVFLVSDCYPSIVDMVDVQTTVISD